MPTAPDSLDAPPDSLSVAPGPHRHDEGSTDRP